VAGNPHRLACIWYWCTDQYIVQRTLAAKDLKNARRGAIWGGFLKVWPVMIFLVPGLTYGSLTDKDRKEIRKSWDKWDVLGSALVLGLVVGFYLYFSFWL
jgi:SSS family solute:Na+ symporter